jgi:hypothetical protein
VRSQMETTVNTLIQKYEERLSLLKDIKAGYLLEEKELINKRCMHEISEKEMAEFRFIQKHLQLVITQLEEVESFILDLKAVK